MICRITVTGVVQGVGYRPFAARLAQELSIKGTVKNSGGSVIIIASGAYEAVEEYIHRLKSQSPEGAFVLRIQREEAVNAGQLCGFSIVESDRERLSELPMLSPDLGICSHCIEELNTLSDRRYRHPFISCTSCGPRYSIMKQLPYDRNTTVMEGFAMCARCETEYKVRGRRQHAQTISCHECGPQLFYKDLNKALPAKEALEEAVGLLKQGGILAVKGIGGFQLLCLPDDEAAVELLRIMKGREKKPFAIMFEQIEQIKKICQVSDQEEALLVSPARPILLLHQKKKSFAPNVSGDSRYLGAFLPSTPLHSLILKELGPLIVTSCNRSSEPIMIREKEVFDWNPGELGGVLYHDREILSPLDDSVAYVADDGIRLIRRSRGYVPLPVILRETHGMKLPEAEHSVLALGSDLKSAFGLFAGERIVLSQSFGDMEHLAIMKAYEKELERMQDLLETRIDRVICDLHPEYVTGYLARRLLEEGKIRQVIGLQHHHAHVLSVMAEHGLETCIGVAFDGTGYGTDGAVWGSEFLYCQGKDMRRRGHLGYVNFCGGNESSRDGSLALLCYLSAAGILKSQIGDSRYPFVQAALNGGAGTFRSSSMGRLFDAVSALLKLRTVNSYEGECAIALENAAWEALEEGRKPYRLAFSIKNKEMEWTASVEKLVAEIRTAFEEEKVSANELALGFHHGVAALTERICDLVRSETGETKVALSGGVFANRLLTKLCKERLVNAGFMVFENEQVPCNDSGIALGQAYRAAFFDTEQEE